MSGPTYLLDLDGAAAEIVGRDEGMLRVRTPDGAVVDVPADRVTVDADGRARADVRFARHDSGALETETFREVEERLHVERVPYETGRVRVDVRTETHALPVEASSWRETVEVERVPVGREVTAIEGPRVVDGVTIVPVYEEVLVVEKRLVLREELHLRTRREAVDSPAAVELRRQTVDVQRTETPPSSPSHLP